MTNHRSKSSLALAAMIAIPVLSWAGTAEKAKAASAAAPEKPSITGNLSLNLDTHFVSFGSDVWGPHHQLLFHPSLEITKAVNDNFKLILGTWWDVNDRGPSTTVGNKIQEVDVWFGGAYTTGALTTTVLYQNWMYPLDLDGDGVFKGESEQAIEVKFAVDTFLSPSLLIHQRFGTSCFGADTIAVLGGAYNFKAGPVSFSIPGSVSLESGGYHGGNSGVGYGSLGLTASVPADFVSKDATFSVGVTGYMTDKAVIPNKKDTFMNLSTGINIPF